MSKLKLYLYLSIIIAACLIVAYFAFSFIGKTIHQKPKPGIVKLHVPARDTLVRLEPLELHDTVRLSRTLYIPQNANKNHINKLIQERDSLECLLDSLDVNEYLEYKKITESHDTIEIKVNTIKNTFDSVSLRFSPRVIHVPEENYSFELKEKGSWKISPFISFGIGAIAGAAGYYLITK